MELEILGSGTSHGIPVIGCDCAVCRSPDPHDNRTRSSALFRSASGTTVVIDAGPEFRIQCLRAGVNRLDAVLVSHSHADHIHGLDDVRIFTWQHPVPIWGETGCIEEIRERFSYIFRKTQEGGGKPQIDLHSIAIEAGRCTPETITIGDITLTPIPLFHGALPVLGWRCGDTAYLTDCNNIPERSIELLQGVRKLIIDALRLRRHSTHFCFQETMEQIEKIGCSQAWFTHLCHDFSHAAVQEWIDIWKQNHPQLADKKIEPAYDGLHIGIECREY